MRSILNLLIKFYQKGISQFLPATCRYYPTCSNYAIEALHKHGALHGGWLAVKRIVRCNPLYPGGFDPVPDTISKNKFWNFKKKYSD